MVSELLSERNPDISSVRVKTAHQPLFAPEIIKLARSLHKGSTQPFGVSYFAVMVLVVAQVQCRLAERLTLGWQHSTQLIIKSGKIKEQGRQWKHVPLNLTGQVVGGCSL